MMQISELLAIAAKQQQTAKPGTGHVTGAAAEYKKYINTCKFKLVVYWKQSKQGHVYTAIEKQQGKNRSYIPSFDFLLSHGGKMVENQEHGFLKLVDKVYQQAGLMEKAILIMNDYVNGLELMIANFDCVQLAHSRYVHPVFKDFNGGRFFSHLEGQPLRVDNLRMYSK